MNPAAPRFGNKLAVPSVLPRFRAVLRCFRVLFNLLRGDMNISRNSRYFEMRVPFLSENDNKKTLCARRSDKNELTRLSFMCIALWRETRAVSTMVCTCCTGELPFFVLPIFRDGKGRPRPSFFSLNYARLLSGFSFILHLFATWLSLHTYTHTLCVN